MRQFHPDELETFYNTVDRKDEKWTCPSCQGKYSLGHRTRHQEKCSIDLVEDNAASTSNNSVNVAPRVMPPAGARDETNPPQEVEPVTPGKESEKPLDLTNSDSVASPPSTPGIQRESVINITPQRLEPVTPGKEREKPLDLTNSPSVASPPSTPRKQRESVIRSTPKRPDKARPIVRSDSDQELEKIASTIRFHDDEFDIEFDKHF